MTILELREKRAKAWETCKSFLDSHRSESGTLSAEDDATYTRMVDPGEHDSLIVYYDHLGDIYEAVGRKEEARTAWSRALEASKQIPYKKWLQSFAEKIKEKLEN